MNHTLRNRLGGLGLLGAIFALPLAGAAMAGRDLAMFFRFPPPLEIRSDYVHFSWAASGLVMAAIGGFAAWWAISGGQAKAPAVTATPPRSAQKSFPSWGWGALGWTLAWWWLAWTRQPWFAALQHYTFFPLWLGFIVSVNALVERATGSCGMRRNPRRWLALFAWSAGFWWTFEWLNRFVRNWHYLAVEDFGPVGYALHATICFSTVLPAVAAVAEWLETKSFPPAGPRWEWLSAKAGGWALIAGGAFALLFTGAQPEFFYPALWLAPLAMLLGTSARRGGRGTWSELAVGNWARAGRWMAAALVCGFFWELWNWHSLAKWIYTVPGVERWHVFEMPLLGYAGYLPFGLECLLVIEWLSDGGEDSSLRAKSQI